MKKSFIYIMAALSLIIGFGTQVNADSLPSELIVQLNGDGFDINDPDPRGMRMPVASLTCTIDFSNLSITSERLSHVLYYELWDEAGEMIVASYTNDYEMVVFMSSLSGCYQLKLVTEETTYIGYIEL